MICVSGAASSKNALRALKGPGEKESLIFIRLAVPSEGYAAAAASRAYISASFIASANACQRAVAVAAGVALNETCSIELALLLTAPSTMAPALPTATSNKTFVRSTITDDLT